MIRLQNDRLARMLHDALYERLHSFCEQYTREALAEPVVQAWLSRLYSGDPSLHILVGLDAQYTIQEHMVIEVERSQHTGICVVHCYQAQSETRQLPTVDEGIEYIDKLVAQVGASCSVFYVAKHSKAFEKRYGYTAIRTAMIKYANQEGGAGG